MWSAFVAFIIVNFFNWFTNRNNDNLKKYERKYKDYFINNDFNKEYWIIECNKCGKILFTKEAEIRREISVNEANEIIDRVINKHNIDDCNLRS